MGQDKIQETSGSWKASKAISRKSEKEVSKYFLSLDTWIRIKRLNNGSCINREVSVQFCERLVGKFRRSTLLLVYCESEEDAKEFLESLKQRLAKFGLEISESKTSIVKFGEKEWQQAGREKRKTESFDFLGFTRYCAKSRNGRQIMGHKTSKINLARKLKEVKEWLKTIRNQVRLKDWWQVLKAKLRGHYNYFGVSGNYRSLNKFNVMVMKLTVKWINRRSQKKSMNREQFMHYKQVNPLPKPKICFSLYT